MPSFDPERHARPLSIAGTLAVVAGLYSGTNAGWLAVAAGVALLLTACYSRQDGFLLFGPFARADAVRSARSRRTHLVRAGIALAAGAVIYEGNFNLLTHAGGYTNLNRNSFRARVEVSGKLAVGIGVLVPFLTVLLVSGAIAEERAAKRWDVLLTTDLRGRELVFGKLLGKLWLVVEPVVVILPVLAMLPLIVGLSPAVMLLFGGAVFVTMLALAGLTALASVATKARVGGAGAVVAVAFGYLSFSSVMLVWTATTPEVGTFPRSLGFESAVVIDDFVEAFNMANPVTTLMLNTARPTPGPPLLGYAVALRQYSAGALGVFLVGTLLACRRVRSVRDPNLAKGLAFRSIRLFGRGKPGESLQEKLARLRPPVTDEPLAWWAFCRAGVFRTGLTGPRSVALAFGFCVAVLLSSYAVDLVGQVTLYPWLQYAGVPVYDWVASATMLGLVSFGVPAVCAVTLIVPVVAATQSVAKERSGDTLESLRLTPLTAREMIEQVHAGSLQTNRLLVRSWALPTTAAVVTGFFPPHVALVLAVLPLVSASPLVSFALYCSAWASSPARATRNLLVGGFVGHWLLLIAGAVLLVVIPENLGVTWIRSVDRMMLNPARLLSPTRLDVALMGWTPRAVVTVAVYAGGLAMYRLLGRWVFRRAVGRFARSRDATA